MKRNKRIYTRVIMLILAVLLLNCKPKETPKQFSDTALNDTFVTLEGNTITFKDILDTHKEQTIILDVWASWCGDCLKGMPKLKELQKQHPEASYVFLSLDKNQSAWRKSIQKYNIQGEHYFMQSGWEGPFGSFIDLDWIPRFIVIDKQGNITLFEADKADDKKLINSFI